MAARLLLVVSVATSFYGTRVAGYNGTLSSLGDVVTLPMWLDPSACPESPGAEPARQTGRDSIAGPECPAGRRGACVAGHVAAA